MSNQQSGAIAPLGGKGGKIHRPGDRLANVRMRATCVWWAHVRTVQHVTMERTSPACQCMSAWVRAGGSKSEYVSVTPWAILPLNFQDSLDCIAAKTCTLGINSMQGATNVTKPRSDSSWSSSQTGFHVVASPLKSHYPCLGLCNVRAYFRLLSNVYRF